MPDDWKTPSQPRLVGHMNDAHGHSVAIDVDRGDVLIRRGGLDICLNAAERDTFMRIFMAAERQAGAWAAQNPPGGPDVVTAEIWCGFPAECALGPAAHLWASDCRAWTAEHAEASDE